MLLKKNKSTKQIKPKNVSALPAKEDFSALDSAVSDLARETEALLGKTGEKMSRPVLPKKKPDANSRAKSFDIIHNPDTNKRSEAILKAPHPGQKLLEAEEAGAKQLADKIEADTKDPEVDSVAEVSVHSPGALKFNEGKTIEPTSNDKSSKAEVKSNNPEEKDKIEPKETEDSEESKTVKTPESKVNKSKATSTDEPDPLIETDSKVDQEVDSKDDAVKLESKVIDLKPEDDKMDGIISLAEQGDTDEPAKTDSSQKVQLFSDNLGESKSDDGEENDGDQPEIFDTDEYHPTLHDWSKLEHHSGWPPVLLLLLLVVAFAGVVYAVVSGMQLPFLPR